MQEQTVSDAELKPADPLDELLVETADEKTPEANDGISVIESIMDMPLGEEVEEVVADGFEEIDALQEAIKTPAVEEAQVVSPPATEPDGQPELPKDIEGVVTKLSPRIYAELMRQWVNRGKPRDFDFQNINWAVYTEGTGGQKFVATGGPGSGIDGAYKSLSIGKI